MFQEAARLQGGNPLSMKAVTIRKRNKLPLDKRQRFYKDILGSGLRGVRVGSWTWVDINQHVKTFVISFSGPPEKLAAYQEMGEAAQNTGLWRPNCPSQYNEKILTTKFSNYFKFVKCFFVYMILPIMKARWNCNYISGVISVSDSACQLLEFDSFPWLWKQKQQSP